MSSVDEHRQGIRSVELGMRIVEAIERLGGPGTLSTVAGEAGMGASTTHRYLVSLIRAGLVKQDAQTGCYDLGAAARRLGIEAIRRSDDVNFATGHAAALRDATGQTVNMSVWADSGPTIIRWEYGRYPLPIVARVGSTLPIVDSSVGRVFLAYLPRAITRSVLRTQQRYKESSSPSDPELAEIVGDVREHGMSQTVGGVVPGLTVIAAPVFGPGGVLSLVLASAVLARMARPSLLAEVGERTCAAADALSQELAGPTAAEMRDASGA